MSGRTKDVLVCDLADATLDLRCLAQSESLLALANGHVGLRGNLDEGEPFGLPGTYLGGFYETRRLPVGPTTCHVDP